MNTYAIISVMKIITGGRYNGKTDYVQKILGYKKDDILDLGNIVPTTAVQTVRSYKVLSHTETFIRNALSDGIDPCRIIKDFVEANPDCVIICDEIGCGIVPSDPFDDNWREITGRLMCELVKEAGGLIRICNGIAEEFKP